MHENMPYKHFIWNKHYDHKFLSFSWLFITVVIPNLLSLQDRRNLAGTNGSMIVSDIDRSHWTWIDHIGHRRICSKESIWKTTRYSSRRNCGISFKDYSIKRLKIGRTVSIHREEFLKVNLLEDALIFIQTIGK